MVIKKMVIKFGDQLFWCQSTNYTSWVYEPSKRVFVRLSNDKLLQVICPDVNTAYHTLKMIQACWSHGCTEFYLDSGRCSVIVTSDDLRNKNSAPKM